jgi:hypothetical protein
MKSLSHCADLLIADFKLRLRTNESHILYALNESIKVIPPQGRSDYEIELKSYVGSQDEQFSASNSITKLDGEDAYTGYYHAEKRKAVFFFYNNLETAVAIGNALRQLCFLLMKEMSTLIMHSAAMLMENGQAILLCGRSGDGKSTAASLLKDMLLISDDLSIVKLKENLPFVWAMPGSKSAPITSSSGFPLAAIFLLVKADFEKIEPVSQALAMAGSLAVHGLNIGIKEIQPGMEILERALKTVSVFNLYFRKNGDLSLLIKNALR